MSLSAKHKSIGVALVAVIGVVVVMAGWAWVGIGTGEVGVEKERGAVTGNVMEPGWHYINPATEGVVKIDTRPRTENMAGDDAIPMLTGDGQAVTMEMSVRYRVEADEADVFHSEYRDHDKALNDLIMPTILSNARTEASGLQADQIITREGRQTLEDSVEASLNENTEGTGITVEAVQFRNVQLNDDYGEALENIEIENTKAEQKQIQAEADRRAYQTRTEGLSDEVLMEKYIDSIDESDKVVLATGEDGTPVMLDASSDQGSAGATTSADELTEGSGGAANESSGNESGGN